MDPGPGCSVLTGEAGRSPRRPAHRARGHGGQFIWAPEAITLPTHIVFTLDPPPLVMAMVNTEHFRVSRELSRTVPQPGPFLQKLQ